MDDKRVFQIFCEYVKRYSCDEANTSQADVHSALKFLAGKAGVEITKCPGLWCGNRKLGA